MTREASLERTFILVGVDIAAQLSEDGSAIGVLTLNTDAGDLRFAMGIDGAEAMINAMNAFLLTAAANAGRHSERKRMPNGCCGPWSQLCCCSHLAKLPSSTKSTLTDCVNKVGDRARRPRRRWSRTRFVPFSSG